MPARSGAPFELLMDRWSTETSWRNDSEGDLVRGCKVLKLSRDGVGVDVRVALTEIVSRAISELMFLIEGGDTAKWIF